MKGANSVTNKELVIVGRALQALLKLNALDELKDIIDLMAESDKKEKKDED